MAVYESHILPILTLLLDDDDRDVRFFAERTLSAVDEAFSHDSAVS